MSLLDTASLIVTPNGYKEGKLYSVIPSDGSGDFSVTRATTATRVNSQGLVESMGNNIPRLDYSNGTCPSILVEPQRTNLNLYSEDLSNAWYNKFNSSISTNSTTAPNGINTADKITENTSNSYHYVETVNVLTAGSTYTISAYLKKAERDFGYIGVYTFESKQIRVNLTNGTIESTVGTWINTEVEDAGNGWYRVIGTFSAFLTSYVFAGPALNGTTPIYAGTTGSGIYLWGAQLEAGSYPTSYIPTTSASVTRNADVISKTGISSIIGQTEGTCFVDFNYDNSTAQGNPLLFSMVDTGSINEVYAQILSSGGIQVQTYLGGVQQSYLFYGGITNGHHKIAYAYKQNDFVLYVDGVQVATDTSGNVPTTNDFYLGYYNTAFTPSVNYNASALWKTRLTNAQLANLTTI